jgi:hypothetical protein
LKYYDAVNREKYIADMQAAIAKFDSYEEGMKVVNTGSGIAIELNNKLLEGNDINHLIADAHNFLACEN